jgi:hypothetical protein
MSYYPVRSPICDTVSVQGILQVPGGGSWPTWSADHTVGFLRSRSRRSPGPRAIDVIDVARPKS